MNLANFGNWLFCCVLKGSASECVLVSMLAARGKAISKYKREHGSEEDGKILAKLVAYTSKLVN